MWRYKSGCPGNFKVLYLLNETQLFAKRMSILLQASVLPSDFGFFLRSAVMVLVKHSESPFSGRT